ncbi:TAXI family TRAP transporter solute-binding subunit [Pontibacterium granulatum]|uniref:TAXI family TRAP transporter solute-binding subunit n=1 Tax=Pontibacterium granulatum TaxID=2036029 RepID=UPI00249A0049|nr:TAXI family TRAP transporter solute-binding subunit [Pontibacterium granulatum]MDI3324358.1 TAXI family TRAP transporter solute-binding subunit [Pontibacterium granulatum]
MKDWLRHLTRSALCGITLSAIAFAPTHADNRIISLGTGGITGLYYPAGGALCRLVNLTREQHGIRCEVRSTPGSVTNLQQVSDGSLDMGIAEAGQLFNARQGAGKFDKPDPELRALINLFPEYISILSRSDSGIERFADLQGKRINIGKDGSSQRITLSMLMDARGWQLDDFSQVHQLAPANQAEALCQNKIDATLYVVGHPSGAIKESLRDCNSRLISLSKDDVDTLTRKNPHYQPLVISGKLYGDGHEDVHTVGVNATLFARADMPDAVAYAMVKSLFTQFERFRRLHPAFVNLKVEDMVQTPLAAPRHPGAERYFKEVGLL